MSEISKAARQLFTTQPKKGVEFDVSQSLVVEGVVSARFPFQINGGCYCWASYAWQPCTAAVP